LNMASPDLVHLAEAGAGGAAFTFEVRTPSLKQTSSKSTRRTILFVTLAMVGLLVHAMFGFLIFHSKNVVDDNQLISFDIGCVKNRGTFDPDCAVRNHGLGFGLAVSNYILPVSPASKQQASTAQMTSADVPVAPAAPAPQALLRPPAVSRHPDVVAQFSNPFGKKSDAGEQKLPKGWRKVPSRSKPGTFSFENIKTKERFDKLPSSFFFDDERDTVSKPAWRAPVVSDDMSDAERAGFGEGGRDLSEVGSELYYAFIPFILFGIAYSNGIFSFGYENGNF